ncbi:hypothetical protein [Bacillus sp. 'calajunan']|uniref:hypothetical protein n=1 Tax=Bacillus sp. 'calajunan' TaxID=3447457 RepID=UPI003EE05B76
MKLNISNENQIKNMKYEIGRKKKELKALWIFCVSFQIMLLSMFYVLGKSIDQLFIVSNLLFDTWILLFTIASTFISGYEIFKLKRKIANLQKNNFYNINEFNIKDTGTASATVYVNKLSKSGSKSDGNKVDEESKRRVFNQNSNVIINSSQPTNTESRKQGNVEIKNKKLESNDETSNTTQVALGVALSVATTTSVFQNDTTTGLGCGSSGDGGGDCGGF